MELIGIPEAAVILSRSRSTIWHWVAKGNLTPVMFVGKGRQRRALFDKTYIEQYAASRVKPEPAGAA